MNGSAQTIGIRQDKAVRSGTFETCTVRFWGPAAADLHCYVINEPYRNVWWFVTTAKGKGWVWEENFSYIPARDYACPI